MVNINIKNSSGDSIVGENTTGSIDRNFCYAYSTIDSGLKKRVYQDNYYSAYSFRTLIGDAGYFSMGPYAGASAYIMEQRQNLSDLCNTNAQACRHRWVFN